MVPDKMPSDCTIVLSLVSFVCLYLYLFLSIELYSELVIEVQHLCLFRQGKLHVFREYTEDLVNFLGALFVIHLYYSKLNYVPMV